MKPLVLEYTLTRDEYVGGLMAVLARFASDDPNRSRILIAYLLVIIAMVLLWGVAGWNQWSLLAALLIIPMGDAAIQRWLGRRGIGTTFDEREANVWLEFSDDGIHERTPRRERRYVWDGVRNVFDTGEALAFDLAGSDLIVVPLRALDADRRAWLEGGMAEFDRTISPRRPADAKAGLRLSETATLAKLSVATAVMGVATRLATLPDIMLAAGAANAAWMAILALVIGLAAAALAFRLTGVLIARIRERSPSSAYRLSWAIVGSAMLAFSIGFLGIW